VTILEICMAFSLLGQVGFIGAYAISGCLIRHSP
jgi:hypothetical protein